MNKVRRPTSIEIIGAVVSALRDIMEGKVELDHQMYGKAIEFVQGPLHNIFIQRLQNIANQDGYYLDDDKEHGLIFKKL